MFATTTQSNLKELYDKDYPLWVETNLKLLKEKKYDQADWENLLVEIEGMSRTELNQATHFLTLILEYLYKWDNFRTLDKDNHKWIKTIENARRSLSAVYKKYPSLKHKVPAEITGAWIDAKASIENWLNDNDYDPDKFGIPEVCPYTYDEAVNRNVKEEFLSAIVDKKWKQFYEEAEQVPETGEFLIENSDNRDKPA